MICRACSEKLPDEARFCGFCGTVLAQRCAVCDNEIVPGHRFCISCGTPVDTPLPSPGAPATTAARKVVTVMFADLSGSTALEERMDAESVRSILDRFYAAMRTDVERHGGTVVKFTGDGVMAAFGVPDVHEDDAVRAVDAALAMQEEIHQLAEDLGLEVRLNIGINTGEVVVAAADDDVVGDSVNVAARLEGAATDGEILVGEETWRLTRATSRYEAIAPLLLKGKSEPVPAYRLLAVDERTADSAAAPFVGRQDELGRLLDAFQSAVDANAARLVMIIGSPGLGKTRLARELMSELGDTARVRETRCDPAGSSTFAPIADALRAGSGISETASGAEVLAALAERLPEDDPDRDRVAERAAAIFGVGLPGTTEETFWALRRLIEAAARQQPVVFVLDDIHWAEPLLLDLIEHLAEWIRDAPVLLVGTARPELRDLRPSLAEGGRAADVLALEGLDQAATAQLALNLLEADSLPSELLAKIPASTEGNPLFVRELVRMLVDDDVLRRTSDGWQVTVDVEAIQVPPTISSLLSARVDRLRNDERSVIELASVVGKEFYRGALVDLAPSGVRDLVDGCLESLRRKELVEPVGTYWIDEPVYRFHHALIRDAAYRRVLKERRADLHEHVAGWLERKTEGLLGEHDELIGYHLEQAHEYKTQLGRMDDELGGRAAELLGAAAQRALDRDDLPAAATLSGRALDRLLTDDPRRSELLIVRCEALLSTGDVAQGAAAVAEFEALAHTPRLRAWVKCFAVELASMTSSERLQETESTAAAAAAELAELGDQAGAAKAHTVHAHTLASLGRFGECEAVLDLALTAARAADDRRRITATLGSAPHAALWGPNPVSRAGGRCLDIVRLLRITTGSPAVEATSLRCQAVLEAFRGRADAARRMLRSAQRTLTELGLQLELLEAEQFAGIIEFVAGEVTEAERHYRAAHDGFRRVGLDVLAARSAARLARALLSMDELDEADAFVAFAERHGGQDLKTAIEWRSTKAELLSRQGDHETARALAQEAVALAERTDALIDHGVASRSLGVVLRAAGDAAGAREAEARALALFERKGATALIERVQPERTIAPRVAAASRASENRCVSVYNELIERITARDWAAVRAMQRDDVVMEDRRVGLGFTSVGIDDFMEQTKIIADLGAVPSPAEVVAIRDDRFALFRLVMVIDDGAESTVEVLQVVEIDATGRFRLYSIFDATDVNAAIAELDQWFLRAGAGTGALANSGPVSSMLALPENASTRQLQNYVELFARRAWDEIDDVTAPDCWFEDRRVGMSWQTIGAHAATDSLKAMADAGTVRIEVEPVAVRGERLSVIRWTVGGRSPTAFETTMLITVGVDDEDRVAVLVCFSVDDLDSAIAELDRRYIAGEGAAFAEIVTAGRAFARAITTDDWDLMQRVIADDVVLVDHRLASWGEMRGIDAFRDVFTSGNAQAVRHAWVDVFHRLSPTIAVSHAHVDAVTPDGMEADQRRVSIFELAPDGRFCRIEYFDPSDLEGAFRRYDELADEPGRASVDRAIGWNRCALVVRDFCDRILAGDVSGAVALNSPVVENDDRRIGLRWPMGAAEHVENVQQAARGLTDVRLDVLATRGERLALLSSTWRYEQRDFEVELLQVVEIGDAGLTTAIVAFDPDDLDDAFAELDGRFLAGEGASSEAVIRGTMASVTSYNSGDLQRYLDLMCDDILVVDHRPASVGRIEGREEWARYFSAGFETHGERRGSITQHHRLGTRTVAFSFRNETIGDAAARTDTDRLCVLRMRGDKIEQIHSFPTEAFDAAIAKFEELDRFEAGPSPTANACARMLNPGFRDLFVARDWTAIEQRVADDCLFEDRRVGFSTRILGRDGCLEQWKTVAAVGATELTFALVATRGERLALATGLWRGTEADTFEVEALHVCEIDERNCWRAIVTFTPDAIDAALAELDDRYLAQHPPNQATFRTAMRVIAAVDGRDWTSLASLLADDFELTDHRPASLGTMGRDEYIASQQVLRDVVPGFRLHVTWVPLLDRDRIVLVTDGRATRDGADIEIALCVAGEIRDGCVVRMEFFPIDRVDEAIRRFSKPRRVGALEFFPLEAFDAALTRVDELASRSPVTTRYVVTSRLTNGATRFLERLQDAMDRRDMDAFIGLHAERFVHDDRRRGIRQRTVGLDEIRRYAETSHELGYGTFRTVEVLALRGDRLALTRRIYRDPRSGADFESEQVIVDEVDGSGRVVHATIFEPSDIDAAFVELDNRYVAGEGAEYGEVASVMAAAARAVTEHRLDDFFDLVAEDTVFDDHRLASLGSRSKDQWRAALTALVELVSTDTLFRFVTYHAIDPYRFWATALLTGVSPDGVEAEFPMQLVGRVAGGQMTALEAFQTDASPEAEASYRALGERRDTITALENAATRWSDDMARSFNEGTWNDSGDGVSADVRVDDRRAGLGSVTTGRDAYLQNMSIVVKMGPHLRSSVIAIRGERLALLDLEWYDPSGGSDHLDVRALHLHELDEDGLLRAMVVFDPDDLDGAVAELDERYAATLPQIPASIVRMSTTSFAAFNHRDWAGYRSALSPDFVGVDRQNASAGAIVGPDAMVEWAKLAIELIPDAREEIVAFHHIDDRGAVAEIRSRGTNAEGGAIEFALVYVGVVADGLLLRMETYPADRLDEALARYRELIADDSWHEARRIAFRAMNDRDWERFAALFDPDLVSVDHRPAFAGRMDGRSAFVNGLRAVMDALPDVRAVPIEVVAVDEGRLLVTVELVGLPDGDPGSGRVHLVYRRTGGLITWMETFPSDRLGDAMSTFESLEADADTTPRNRAWFVYRKATDARGAGDTAAFLAVHADDCRIEDHRPGLRALTVGASAALDEAESMRSIGGLMFHRECLDVRGDHVALVRRVFRDATDPVAFEIEVLTIYEIDADDRICRIDHYVPEDLDEIRAELDARLGVPLENAATQAAIRNIELILSDELVTYSQTLAPDVSFEDRRTGLGHDSRGPEALLDQLRALRELGTVDIEQEPLALRGGSLALMRTTVVNGDVPGFDVDALTLVEIDASGRTKYIAIFDADDLDPALDELDERFIAGEGAPFAGLWRAILHWRDVRDKGDWAAFEQQVTEDCVYVDHRPAMRSELVGREAIMSIVRNPLTPDSRQRMLAVHAIDHAHVLVQSLAQGTNSEGGDVEVPYLNLFCLRGDRIRRVERFSPDDLEAALTRFGDLRAAPDRWPLENDCSRATSQLIELILSRDWDAMRQMVSDSFHGEDRRAGLRATYDVTAQIEMYRAMHDLGMTRFDASVIATRGERLTLLRVDVAATPESGEEFTVEVVAINELDPDGLFVWSALFDPSDLDAAYVELDGRFAAGEGASAADFLRISGALTPIWNGQRWDEIESLWHPDGVFVDHRPVSPGEVGLDGLMALIRDLGELVPDVRHEVVAMPRWATDIVLARIVARGTSADGGSVDFEYIQVACVSDGLFTRVERFDVDDFDSAVARFDELVQPDVARLAAVQADASDERDWKMEIFDPADVDAARGRFEEFGPRSDVPSPLENGCTRVRQVYDDLFEQRRWGELAALFADGFVSEDRRLGLREVHDRQTQIEMAKVIADLGVRSTRGAAVATRGERLALFKLVGIGADGDVIAELLALNELDEDNRYVASVLFELSDTGAAFAELEERYAVGEGAAFATQVRFRSAVLSALNAHDWDRFLSYFAEDFEFVDHQPAGFGVMTGRPTIWANQVRELVPDIRLYAAAEHAVGSSGGVFEMSWRGHDAHGNPLEGSSMDVFLFRDERITRREQFPVERLDDALARFSELTAPDPDVSLSFDTRAIRAWRRFERFFEARDWESFGELFSADSLFVDRRRGMAYEIRGRDIRLENVRVIGEMGARVASSTPLAVRGERLALYRMLFRSEDGTEVELLQVDEYDEDGRLATTVCFDPDDLDAAYAELDERYLAGEAAGAGLLARLTAEAVSAFNDGDWHRFRALFRDDLSVVDHRLAGSGRFSTADEFVESNRVLSSLFTEVRLRNPAIYRVSPDALCSLVHGIGRNSEGGQVEMSYVGVAYVRDDLIASFEYFPTDRLDDALARFDELTTAGLGQPQNECARATLGLIDLILAKDWQRIRSLASRAFHGEDRRPGLGNTYDIAGQIEMYRTMHDLGMTRFDASAVATRGERLALMRMNLAATPERVDEFTVELLVLNELDAEGLFVGSVLFDLDELGAAFDELDRRFAASDEGPAFQRFAIDLVRAYNARDWDVLRGGASDSFVMVDHTPASRGRVEGRDAWVGTMLPLIELVPDLRLDVRRILHATEHRSIVITWVHGTDLNGNAIEIDSVYVCTGTVGALETQDIHPLEHLPAVLDAFGVPHVQI